MVCTVASMEPCLTDPNVSVMMSPNGACLQRAKLRLTAPPLHTYANAVNPLPADAEWQPCSWNSDAW